MSVRKDIAAILADRWSLDQEDGWDEFGEATLDDIMAAVRKPVETMFLPGVQDSVRVGTRDRVLELLK